VPDASRLRALRKTGPLGPPRGWFFRLYWPITAFLVTNITVTILWVLFFVLNRTTVVGRKNVGYARNTLLLSNHQSMLDSFVVGLGAFFPQSWWRPHLIPWNPAAAENFYRTPILAWLADNWKCIWVRPGRRDLHALHKMIEVLPAPVGRWLVSVTLTVAPSVTISVGPGSCIVGQRPMDWNTAGA